MQSLSEKKLKAREALLHTLVCTMPIVPSLNPELLVSRCQLRYFSKYLFFLSSEFLNHGTLSAF
jgi:hypothetical protein